MEIKKKRPENSEYYKESLKYFKIYFIENFNIENIFTLCFNQTLSTINLRPLIWKILLDHLPIPKSTYFENWTLQINKNRVEYISTREKYMFELYSPEKLSEDLMKENLVLEKQISMDVERTYQKDELFRLKETKDILKEVLFIWSKKYPNISYKQGMNEIVAVLFVILEEAYFYNDVIRYEELVLQEMELKGKESTGTLNSTEYDDYINNLFLFIHDIGHIKVDLFILFEKLLNKGIKELFDINPVTKNEKENEHQIHLSSIVTQKLKNLFQLSWETEESNNLPSVEENLILLIRCKRITKDYLPIINSELFNYFAKVDIDCLIFIQRWLKCLFNREFGVEDTLKLWDVIFVIEFRMIFQGKKTNTSEYSPLNHLDFIDFISLAMLDLTKEKIIGKDQEHCYLSLFKLENLHLNQVINLGLKLRNRVLNIYDDDYNGQIAPRVRNLVSSPTLRRNKSNKNLSLGEKIQNQYKFLGSEEDKVDSQGRHKKGFERNSISQLPPLNDNQNIESPFEEKPTFRKRVVFTELEDKKLEEQDKCNHNNSKIQLVPPPEHLPGESGQVPVSEPEPEEEKGFLMSYFFSYFVGDSKKSSDKQISKKQTSSSTQSKDKESERKATFKSKVSSASKETKASNVFSEVKGFGFEHPNNEVNFYVSNRSHPKLLETAKKANKPIGEILASNYNFLSPQRALKRNPELEKEFDIGNFLDASAESDYEDPRQVSDREANTTIDLKKQKSPDKKLLLKRTISFNVLNQATNIKKEDKPLSNIKKGSRPLGEILSGKYTLNSTNENSSFQTINEIKLFQSNSHTEEELFEDSSLYILNSLKKITEKYQENLSVKDLNLLNKIINSKTLNSSNN